MSKTLQFYSADCILCAYRASALRLDQAAAALTDHVEWQHRSTGLVPVVDTEKPEPIQ